MRRLGPFSRQSRLYLIDGRRAEAKLLNEIRAELTAHVGGNPSAVQRRLIERAALIHLRLHLMDQQTLSDPVMGERNSRYYLAWSGAYTRLLVQLGINSTHGNQTLREVLLSTADAA